MLPAHLLKPLDPFLLVDCLTYLGIDIPYPSFSAVLLLSEGTRYLCTLHWFDEDDEDLEHIALLDVTIVDDVPTITTVSFVTQSVKETP